MTIKDVAKHSGVSVSTVSRVLNNHPDVSDEVRAKVLETAEKLHYVPNSSARDLVRPQSDSIGVVVRGAGNPFFSAMIHAIELELEQAGYSMILHQIRAEADELTAGASLARSKRLRGLLFLGGDFDYTQERIALLSVPFVCCTYTNSFGTLKRSAFSSVSIDDYAEAKKAVRILTDRGHRKIAIILDSKNDHSISELRYRGYCDALKEAGIDYEESLVEEVIDYDMKAAYEGTKRLLVRRRDVTAIFVIADSMAIAAMKALYEAGIRVPEECSVIAIDGIDVSQYTVPTLTTIVQPCAQIGMEAVHRLIGVIEQNLENEHMYMETRLREGGTVADAPHTETVHPKKDYD